MSRRRSPVTKVKQLSLSCTITLLEDPRWQLVQRVLNSPGFSRSARLPNLLTYITERALTGRTDELTEQQIGVNVFGRPADYNPAENNIVRSHARLLRLKLEEYYRALGDSEDLLLTIPKGGYVPVFTSRMRPPLPVIAESAGADTHIPERIEATPRASPLSFGWRAASIMVVSILVMSALLALVLRERAVDMVKTNRAGISHLLWSRIFEPDRTTLLVVADSALVMYENLTNRPVSLSEYLNRQYLSAPVTKPDDPDAAVVNSFPSRRYTSMADLNLASRLVSLPEVVHDRVRMGYARDLGMNDFKQANIVLSGAAEANPWVELYSNRLAFDIQEDQSRHVFGITNSRVGPGEKALYTYDPGDSSQWAYAVVAFLPAKNGDGNVLIIEGTTTAGTEAASDFILDGKTVAPILKRALLVDGSLGGFEVLLRTRNVAGSAPQAQLVTSHFDRAKS